MKIKYLTSTLAALALSLTAVQAETILAVNFEGDYGGNTNSALARDLNFTMEDQGDFNNDGNTDTRRYFSTPETLDLVGALGWAFDQDLFGRNNNFQAIGSIVSYSAPPGTYHEFSLFRWAAGRQGLQVTSGAKDPAELMDDMGLLAAFFVKKSDFLNGADETDVLYLPNKEDAFNATVFFRGEPLADVTPTGFRRARFMIRADGQWYVSRTGTPVEEIPVINEITYDLAINPSVEYWHEYNADTAFFVFEEENSTIPSSSSVRGDSLTNITDAGVIIQNTRFTNSLADQMGWLEWHEFSFELETVAPTPANSWAFWTIDESGWIDTDSGDNVFMGSIYVNNAPWIYVQNLNKYIYLPEDFVTESGTWSYILD